jgi:hypothetical protein
MLLRVLLFFVLCMVLLAGAGPLATSLHVPFPALAIGAITAVGTLLLTMAFARWDKVSLRNVGAAPGRLSIPRFVVGFLLGLLLVALHVSIEAAAGHVTWTRSSSVSVGSVALSLATFVLLACREELAFRGYPLRRLNSVYGLWIAQAVVAIVFALEHVAGGATWTNALLGSGMGSLLFGMAAIATEGLAVPIGLHAAWNFGDWMHGGKDSTGIWQQVVPDAFARQAEITAMAGYVVVILGGAIGFRVWHQRRQNLMTLRTHHLE